MIKKLFLFLKYGFPENTVKLIKAAETSYPKLKIHYVYHLDQNNIPLKLFGHYGLERTDPDASVKMSKLSLKSTISRYLETGEVLRTTGIYIVETGPFQPAQILDIVHMIGNGKWSQLPSVIRPSAFFIPASDITETDFWNQEYPEMSVASGIPKTGVQTLKGIDHVYILHYHALTERKKFMETRLLENGITNYTFVNGPDRGVLNDMMRVYYDPKLTKERWTRHYEHDRFICTSPPSVITNAMGHIHALEKMVESGHSVCLMLEDDCILPSNFVDKWNQFGYPLPKDLDIGYIHENGWKDITIFYKNLVDVGIPKWFKIPEYINKTCAAYVMTQNAAELILSQIIPFSMPIDEELTYCAKICDLNVYWMYRGIVEEGSVKVWGSSVLQQSQERYCCFDPDNPDKIYQSTN